MSKKIIIIGGGGHARVLLDIIQLNSCEVAGYLDAEEKENMKISYLGKDDKIMEYAPDTVALVNGIGSVKRTEKRQQIFEKFKGIGYHFHAVIHPQAILSKDIQLGEGVQVIAGVVINVGAKIGDNVIINTRASIDHDCVVGAHTHIAPGVAVSGCVSIGQGCHVGTGVNIIQGIVLGDGVLVAAGETIRTNQPNGATVFSKG
ncbi:MAG: acetyltransferase [Candidatus Omnitrophica bacterium]|nr:acetyltransferase [Candidatus Omnitrophota bacterium]